MAPRIVCLCVAIAISACARSGNPSAEATNPPPEADGANGAAPQQEATSAETEPVDDAPAARSFEPIGVPECDEYTRLFQQCVEEKLPADMQEQSLDALAESVEAWRKAAESDAGRTELAEACVRAREAVAASCGW